MKNICVFCGSSLGAKKEYADAARKLGYILAAKKIRLVYGGGNIGLMGITADAVLEKGGKVLGVMPKHLADKEVAHKGLQQLKIVNSMHERKALIGKVSDAFIALPGGYGTLDEIFEAITWGQLKLHMKPCGFLNICGFYDKLMEFLDLCVCESFINLPHRNMLIMEKTPEKLVERLFSYEHPSFDKVAWTLKDNDRR